MGEDTIKSNSAFFLMYFRNNLIINVKYNSILYDRGARKC